MSWDRRHRTRTNQSAQRLGLLPRLIGTVGKHAYTVAKETINGISGVLGGALASGAAVTMAERSGHDVPTAVTVGVVAVGTAIGQTIAKGASSTVDAKTGMGDTTELVALLTQAGMWARDTSDSMIASNAQLQDAEGILRQVAGRTPAGPVLESLQELAEARQLLGEAKVLSDGARSDIDTVLVHYMSG